jgi:chloramphenicol 3-O-phosphotransferase
MKIKLVLLLTMSMAVMKSTGNVILLYGTCSAGKSSIHKCLQKLFMQDAVFISVDEIAWKPVIEYANKIGLINEQMPSAQQYDIMMQHIDMLSIACDDAWLDGLKELYDRVKALASIHKYVILETMFYVYDNQDINYFLQQMEGISVFSILAYCSPSIIAKRVVQRNTAVDYKQKREVMNQLISFCDLYRPVCSTHDEMWSVRVPLIVDTLTKEEVEKALDIIHGHLIEVGITESLVAEKINKLRELYYKTFFVDAQTEVAIIPRLAYTMMLNTDELSSHQCAQLIYEKFMESLN